MPGYTMICNKPKAFTLAARSQRRNTVVVRAQEPNVSRRDSLASMAATAALISSVPAALAAYGDSANVFGKTTNSTGFIPYAGDGFAVKLPSKWNPSKEREFPGTIIRYEDNFDTINSFSVIANNTDKSEITEFGTPDDFLGSITYLFGKQSFSGETQSEGGFAADRVSAASILDISSFTDKKGKTYYCYDVLTRTADGDEGGKHQLVKATVSNGKLWLLKVQVGDKRWFKGVKKEATGVFDSFVVA